MEEYHKNTCIRFRPYKKADTDYVTIESKNSGCWSLVGKHDRGQVVNLQNPGCVHHGVVVHELLHALGFYHQQSAANRDEWVKINWENIQSGNWSVISMISKSSEKMQRFENWDLFTLVIIYLGKEHNFNKYNNDTVTDYGISYDYGSVMHYSSHAFSKNDEPTITPLVSNQQLNFA